MSDIAQTGFGDRDCLVGGVACPCWAEWYQARREFARTHPRAAALDAIVDDDAHAEALDDLAEELDAEYVHARPSCAEPGCPSARH